MKLHDKERITFGVIVELAICTTALAILVAVLGSITGCEATDETDCAAGTVKVDGDCVPDSCPAGTALDGGIDEYDCCKPVDAGAGCPAGYQHNLEGCCIYQADEAYKVQVSNCAPQGFDALYVDGIAGTAQVRECSLELRPSGRTPGGYWLDDLDGNCLTEPVETVHYDVIQPCFGRYDQWSNFTRGKLAETCVERNSVECTHDYRPLCSGLNHPTLREFMDLKGIAYTSDIHAQCCAIFDNGDMATCQVCPNFDITHCTGPIFIENGSCNCELDAGTFPPDIEPPDPGADEPQLDPTDPLTADMFDCLSTSSPGICCGRYYINERCEPALAGWCDAKLAQIPNYNNECAQVTP